MSEPVSPREGTNLLNVVKEHSSRNRVNEPCGCYFSLIGSRLIRVSMRLNAARSLASVRSSRSV